MQGRPLFDGIDTPVESPEAVSVTAGLENDAAKGGKNMIRRVAIDQNGSPRKRNMISNVSQRPANSGSKTR